MTAITTLLIISLLFNFILYKNTRKYKKYLKYLNSNVRCGVLDIDFTQGKNNTGTVRFEIEEIEKYENDISKVRLKNAKIISGSSSINRTSMLNYAKENFSEFQKTSTITWLVVEETLKEKRKNKLKELFKNSPR